MSLTSAIQTEQKFSTLRNRLDQLGYLQTLGIESLPLVERLFSDLVQTIESLRNQKKTNSELNSKCDILELAVEPYKLENGQLLSENNKLHQQIIHQKEKWEATVREQKLSSNKLERENSDLRFLNTQYLVKVRSLEKESREKSEQILDLQEKNLQAVIQTPGGKKHQIPFRRQRLEIASPPPSLAQPYELPYIQNQCKDAYVADLLKTSENNFAKLQIRVENLTRNLEEFEKESKSLKTQVNVRDLEIRRLGNLLEAGRPLQAILSKSIESEKEDIIMQLKVQLSHIDQQNSQLSEELRSLRLKANKETKTKCFLKQQSTTKLTSNFDSNKEMEFERRNTNSKTKRFEEELFDQLKESKKKNTSVQIEIEKLQQTIKDLRSKLSVQENQQTKIEILLQKVNEDKERLALKVKEHVANEKDLIVEIDRLSRKLSATSPSSDKTSNKDTFDSLMIYTTQLETQRDRYKEEARALIRLLQSSRGKETMVETPSSNLDSAAMLKLLDEERNFYKKQYHDLLEDNMTQGRRRAPSGCVSTHDKGISVNAIDLEEPSNDRVDLTNFLQEKLDQSQEAINRLLNEKEDLIAQNSQSNHDIVRLQNALIDIQNKDVDNNDDCRENVDALEHLTAENNLLNQKLQSFSVKNKSLQNEVDSLESQLNQVKEKLFDCQTEVKNFSLQTNPKSQMMAEFNAALTEIEDLKTANSEMNNEYRNVQAQLLNENEGLRERVNELETIHIPTEDLRVSEGSVPKGRLSTLETEMISLQYEVKSSRNEMKKLQRKLEDGEKSVSQLKKFIEEKENDLKMAENDCKNQKNRIGELEKLLVHQTGEIELLNEMVSSLNSDKQHLNTGHYQRDQHLAGLQQHINEREVEAQGMQSTLTSLDTYAESLRKEISEKETTIKKLSVQLDSFKTEQKNLEDEQDAMRRENRRLLEDLTTITVQHQRVGEELDSVANEKVSLHRQIQEYVTEVTRVQELLSIKERERIEILEQYEHLSVERDLLENHSKELESQNSSVNHILISKDSQLRNCQETIVSLEQEIHQHIEAQEEYNQEMTSLNSSVNDLESELDQSRQEAEGLRQNLSSTREICKSLEDTNRTLQRQIYTGESDKEHLSGKLLELQEEMVQLREHLTVSRTSVDNLESLLVNCREKEFKQQLTYREMKAEVEHLRKRLKEMEEKMEKECGESATFKSQLSKLEMDGEKIKRQLTNERFEKERVSQELRRFRQQHNCFLQTESSANVTGATKPKVTFATEKSSSGVVREEESHFNQNIAGSSSTTTRLAATFSSTIDKSS